MSESFEEFAAGRAQDLWRAAWLLTGDRALAEDLVQTALMKSWPRFERLTKNGGSFEGYVRRTMYTTYCTWWRRHWKASAIERDEEQHDPALERSDLLRDLSSALSELSRQQRAVVVLRYFEGLTEREIAERLGCSIGSVKSHHSRALHRLKESTFISIEHLEQFQ